MANPDDTEYLRSLPKKEAERILHTRSVALNMMSYTKWKVTNDLATLMYGSTEVVSSFPQSLGDNYLRAYLAQPLEARNAADALTHSLHADHNDTHTAAILIAKFDGELLEAAATKFSVSTKQVQTALIIGIAELLDGKQMALVGVLATILTTGSFALRKLQHPNANN